MKLKMLMLASLLAATPGMAQEHMGHHDSHETDTAPTSADAHANAPPHDHARPAVAPDGHQGHEDHAGQNGASQSAIYAMSRYSSGMPCGGSDEAAAITSCASLPRFAQGSGTSRLPGLGNGMTGLHVSSGDWMLMAHGFLTLNYTDHKGPRGDDHLYSTSMVMLTGERSFAGARLQLRSMLSLEPTMAARGYPNLFGTGETADGQPLVDRQHPHDLFMELTARLDVDIAPGASLFLYGGPVGEPAIGPTAFMMRSSARYNPEPPITHHWFDATHITYGVVTTGIATGPLQIEASAFRGREPDEERWDIETPKLDSWSTRLTWTPRPSWAVQVSHAFLKQPETLHGNQNEHRTTASIHYGDGRLSAMAAFSAKNRDPGDTLIAWLGEFTYDLTPRHSLFGRVEHVTNDELVPDHHDPLHDVPFAVTKAQAGYAWNTPIGNGPVHLALGGSVSLYGKPAALDPIYGSNPWGYTLFARLSLGK